ncbi:MAG: diguanylate cyclase (GGDEF)-like protein [Candidatus Azotimanducaceae bacterium]|jgi:diguanylate cyclase (GGDEF)-like protein
MIKDNKSMSLRTKIQLFFLSLLIISSVATLGSVLFATNSNVKIQAEEKLLVGKKVFDRLILEQGNQLLNSARVLIADFGFKTAVTTFDVATIQSALENNSDRIGAEIMMLAGLDGELIAVSSNEPVAHSVIPPQILLSESNQSIKTPSSIAMIDGRIFQLVNLPVKAPVTVARAVIGKSVDQAFARQLAALTGLEVRFFGQTNTGSIVRVSTLEGDELSTEDMDGPDQNTTLAFNNEHEYLSLKTSLTASEDYQVDAILYASLDEAYARYEMLKQQILVIAGITLFLSLLATIMISRNITGPIANLVASANLISTGNYHGVISSESSDSEEIRALTQSLQIMQHGIAEREGLLLTQAFRDSLTGIGNRLFLMDILSQLINDADTLNFALLRIDITDFKQINDTFGYQASDALVKEFSQRLVNFSLDEDWVARLSAGRFTLIVPQLVESNISQYIDSLIAVIAPPFLVAEVSLQVEILAGVSLFPDYGNEAEKLLRRAEIAIDLARIEHQPFSIYQQGQDESHLRKIALVRDLKTAIEENLLQLHYQPKLDLSCGRVNQVEALLRWTHHDLGFISPEEFVALAEQSGLMPALTDWVLKSVFDQASRWQQMKLDIAIAVNLSVYDIVEFFPAQMETRLKSSGLSSDRIILEITEGAVMANPELAIQVLLKLRNLGFKLSIDDYGTGYSSLAKLKTLPVDELKIDKAFVMQLNEDRDDQVIVESTIELAHNINLTVVAEGVENEESYQLLEQWGCDKLQGYFISRPLAVAQFETWLHDYESQNL